MDINEFNLGDDNSKIVVSDDICKIIKLMVFMGDIQNRIYDLLGDLDLDSSVDDKFQKNFSDSFININDNLSKLLKYYVVDRPIRQENVTEDSIRI